MRVLLRPERRPPPAFHPAPLPPLDLLLADGGDLRLNLDPASGLNIYGCRPAPRAEALAFSSSTANSISERGWRRAALVRRQLAQGDNYDALVEAARAELARHLGLAGMGTAIVFAPSGTDAALHALAVARALSGAPLVSILAASDETGSGVPLAAAGRHFARSTAQGTGVIAGAPIAGLGDGVDLAAVPLRHATGELRPAQDSDRDILAAAAWARADGSDVLLYAMDHSKLGNRCPSDDCLAEIETRYSGHARIVVDACQARLGLDRLHLHLARDRMVLITGSKFFGGPPLSGALLVPASLAAAMARRDRLAPGLRDYSAASDWPHDWRAPRQWLGARQNIGQLLRWSAALEEMGAWFAVPALRRSDALSRFGASVARAISGCGELALLDWPGSGDAEFPAPTIFPFLLQANGTTMSPAQCGKLHRALNLDMRGLLPRLAGDERALAALPCHIGQPVSVAGIAAPRGALRISAGARIVTEPVRDLDAAIARIFAKVRLLLRNFEVVERAL
jgi:hypothetical protein